jgi:hypothetical protein
MPLRPGNGAHHLATSGSNGHHSGRVVHHASPTEFFLIGVELAGQLTLPSCS